MDIETSQKHQEIYQKVISHYGSAKALAEQCGVKHQVLSNAPGLFPIGMCLWIEKDTRGKFKALDLPHRNSYLQQYSSRV